MQIEKMNRPAVRKIAEALEKAAKEVADEMGLDVRLAGGRFDPDVGTLTERVEFSLAGAEEKEFGMNAPLFELTAEDYGKEFSSRGERYRLVGLSTRRPKYPVVGERVRDGKKFKFTESSIRAMQSAHREEKVRDARP